MSDIEALRLTIIELDVWLKDRKGDTPGVPIEIEADVTFCELCGTKLHVQKTVWRTVVTLRYNSFRAHERVLSCPKGCKHPSGALFIRRSQQLAELAPKGARYGYDVEVFVGLERYVRFSQRKDIREKLESQYSLSVSDGEISALGRRFLNHVEMLHQSRAEAIREAMQQDGGYPLHIDSTTEDGKGTLLVIFAGWRGWVLGAWKIPSERKEFIAPYITSTMKLFGKPVAFVRDLGQTMAQAIDMATCELANPPRTFACHFHFLRDIGKDILGSDYEEIRKLARKYKVRDNIRIVVRELRKKINSSDMANVRFYTRTWFDNDGFAMIPAGERWGTAIVIVLAQWVLDYAHDGNNLGFPFDRPYYRLYARCQSAIKAIDTLLEQSFLEVKVIKALTRLKKAIEPFVTGRDTRGAVRSLEIRMDVFDKFRDVFRLEGAFPESMDAVSSDARLIKSDVLDVFRRTAFGKFETETKDNVDSLADKLRIKTEAKCTSADAKVAMKIILDHLERHGKFLWGHIIGINTSSSVIYRLVERTNNMLEQFFRGMKHGERRRSGRKVLTRDFEELPPSAALAQNFANEDYVNVVCGSIDNLPRLFYELDAECQRIKNGEKYEWGDETAKWFAFEFDKCLSATDKKFSREGVVDEWIKSASQGKSRKFVVKQRKQSTKPFEAFDKLLIV